MSEVLTINITPEQQERLTNMIIDDRIEISELIQQIQRQGRTRQYWLRGNIPQLEDDYKLLGTILEEVSGHPIND